MAPQEILVSESQERMLLIVRPDKVSVVLSIAERWGLLATVIGEVTGSGRLVVNWRGQTVVDVPPSSLADEGPVYARPMREPNDLPLLHADRAETLPRPRTDAELRETLLRMAASPNLCDKTWVTEQYDRYVLGNTVLAQPEDAGVLRLDETTGLGIALSVDGNGRYTRLDPYRGAQLALAEAYRNVAVTGATSVAVTNCLNFGSPEDPQVMWQFAEAARGLSDGGLAQALVECTLRNGVGAVVAFAEGVDPFVALFSESAGRALVAVPLGQEKAFLALVDEHGLPYTPLGMVGGGSLEVRDHFTIPLDELRDAWSGTLPALFGSPAPAASVELEIEVAVEPEAAETEAGATEPEDEPDAEPAAGGTEREDGETESRDEPETTTG